MGIKWNQLNIASRERTSQILARHIKELIFNGRLRPNEKLPTERELAQELGTSRTSVREAMLSLEQAGMIKIQRGYRGGFFVAEPATHAIAETLNDQLRLGKIDILTLTDARIIIEPSTAQLAARRRSNEDLEKIERSIIEYRERIHSGAQRSLSDFDFHSAVAEASGNLVMVTMIVSLMELLYETAVLLELPRPNQEQVNRHHERIFKAIQSRDEDLAYMEMERHVCGMVSLWVDQADGR